MKLSLWLMITSYWHIGFMSLAVVSRFYLLMNKDRLTPSQLESANNPYGTFSNLLTWFSVCYVIWYKWGF